MAKVAYLVCSSPKCDKPFTVLLSTFKRKLAGGQGYFYCDVKCYWEHSIKDIGDIRERILANHIKDVKTGCWNWPCSVDYGNLVLDGKYEKGHRASYRAFKGEIPKGMVVRHICVGNRKCVNPDHLELGTKGDNAKDMMRDGTSTYGEKNPCAKLTDVDVLEIRRLGNMKTEEGSRIHSVRNISKKFGVSEGIIYGILRGRSWRHLL